MTLRTYTYPSSLNYRLLSLKLILDIKLSPSTQAMFNNIDLTRLEHDLPRLKRLFHCVSEIDDFGWPRLTAVAIDIELRAASVPEETRARLLKELDPMDKGEVSWYTPLYIHNNISK